MATPENGRADPRKRAKRPKTRPEKANPKCSAEGELAEWSVGQVRCIAVERVAGLGAGQTGKVGRRPSVQGPEGEERRAWVPSGGKGDQPWFCADRKVLLKVVDASSGGPSGPPQELARTRPVWPFLASCVKRPQAQFANIPQDNLQKIHN